MATTTPNASVPTLPTVKVFNQGFFDFRDPTDFAGIRQPRFSIAHTYTADKTQLPQICNELYTHVLSRLKDESIGKVSVETTDYLDSRQQGKEGPRRYLVVESETNRGTRLSIFIRFLPFGDNLYVGVDSYVLGSLDWIGLIIRVLITLVPLFIIFFYFSVVSLISLSGQFRQGETGGSGLGLFCCIVPAISIVLLLWIDVFRAFKRHGDLYLALRQNFNNVPSDHSFNIDDILMFFKSSLPLVIFSVQDVLQKHDLPIKTLDDFVANINNVVNISSGGGILSIIGSVIGGRNNRISA